MIETSSLLFFITASSILIVAPGPDIVFLITQGLSRGPRAGFATAMGLAAGNLVHTLAAALGVSVVFRASALAFQGLKVAGVLYLIYLAWNMIREKERGAGGASKTEESFARSTESRAPGTGAEGLFWRGVLMNILNPKVALFFLAFLPQFTSTTAGPIWRQMLIYGVLFTALVVVVFGLVGTLAGSLSGLLGRRVGGSRWSRRVKWTVAGVYAALAVRLALAQR